VSTPEERRIYSDPRWKQLRIDRLNLDNWQCVICHKPAKQVDHLLEMSAGGEPFPPLTGLQSLCVRHHIAKTAKQGRSSNIWRRVPPEITLVWAVPGIDLWKWLQDNVRNPEADLVIDYSNIAHAYGFMDFSGSPFDLTKGESVIVRAERERLIRQLRSGRCQRYSRCYLTSTAPDAPDLMPSHRAVDLTPDSDAYFARMATGEIDERYRQLAEAFYAHSQDMPNARTKAS
jgi:hypothetical protein